MGSQATRVFPLDDNPLWYKDAILYELHVRSFYDSNGDGIGDFRGLAQKLDYLRDLGVTAIWLLPFYPSPLKDDGYDIAAYTSVNPTYGALRDVKLLIREAHKRGLRVVTELVCNHTSDQHPWFQRARRAKPGTVWRDFYVWSDTPERYKDTRIIFKDFETSNWTWDPMAQAYYWHRFYSHQPDLNYDNPHVQKAMFQILDFWLGMGIDGLRLDAVPYLYEREGTNCENLPETHAFLKALRRHVDARHPNRMLLAEANQWPEHAVPYFGQGDECHMAFHFPVMPRLFMAIRMEDRFPIVDILAQTPPIPDNCQWAVFLRNHDELTLEMVTDEERDYMYRVYAHDPQMRINLGIRRRLAPLLGNHRRRIELMNGLLFSLPGTPVIYYGDEIGMGDNIYLGDRNSVRTPMQWSNDRNAGFSTANRQKLFLPVIVDPEYHFESINVEAQQHNPHSLLSWMKRLIALRKRYRAFGRGSLEFLHPENRKVLAFIRHHEHEHILVIANLSRFVQCAELDLSAYQGVVPVEMFGRTEFPPIGELPYFITLAPHTFYWFALTPAHLAGGPLPAISPATMAADATGAADAGGGGRPGPAGAELPVPALVVAGGWENCFRNARPALEDVLPRYLMGRRWFGGKARRVKSAQVREAIPVTLQHGSAYLTLVTVDYTDGPPETYVVPLAFASGEAAVHVQERQPSSVVAFLQTPGDAGPGVLYDALWDAGFCAALLEAILRRRRFKGAAGEVVASPTAAFRWTRGMVTDALEPSVSQAEQSNNSVIFGERFFLKLFRRVEEGLNPDLEIGLYLTEHARFNHIPPLAGMLEYRPERGEPITLAVLQGYVPNGGDAWQYTLGALEAFFDRVLDGQAVPPAGPRPLTGSAAALGAALPAAAESWLGDFLGSVRLLGQRTAGLHCALAAGTAAPAFAPEPFTPFYQRALLQSLRGQVSRVFGLLRRRLDGLAPDLRHDAARLLQREDELVSRYRSILDGKLTAQRIRCHGDYHLGQVLYTGHDFLIIDFEGEPARPLAERRNKRSPLSDVAGMLRSLHYAAQTALQRRLPPGEPDPGGTAAFLSDWADWWVCWVSAAFVQSYLEAAENGGFLPRTPAERSDLLALFLLDKAVYELGYELNHRPAWVTIPLRGTLALLEVSG